MFISFRVYIGATKMQEIAILLVPLSIGKIDQNALTMA